MKSEHPGDRQEAKAQKPHILVVDDDERICSLVMRYLSSQDFVVMSAHNGAQAREMLDSFSFDALVVDVMMPGESGLELTHYIREDIGLPVIMLTALGEVEDRLKGFESGADDYLPKPFEPKELVMRLQAILRRTGYGDVQGGRKLQIGDWIYNPEFEVLSQANGESEMPLTTMEAKLLKALSSKLGEPISRDELAEKCGIDAGERTIDVQVTRLRRKIEADNRTPRYLQTVRGQGYLLRADIL